MKSKVPASNVKLKRAYDPPAADDGTRILIDRLWPRGVTKKRAAIDQWMKDISPSTELRKWFSHDPARWDEFRRRYAQEVRKHSDLLDQLRSLARHGPITLVYSAHDREAQRCRRTETADFEIGEARSHLGKSISLACPSQHTAGAAMTFLGSLQFAVCVFSILAAGF